MAPRYENKQSIRQKTPIRRRRRDSLLSQPLAAGMPPSSPQGWVYGELAKEVVSPEPLNLKTSELLNLKTPERINIRLPSGALLDKSRYAETSLTPAAGCAAGSGACCRWPRRPRQSAAGCCHHRRDRRRSAPPAYRYRPSPPWGR